MNKPVKITKVRTGSVYEEKNSYSRLITLGDFILVSNTAGRNYATREIASTALEQAERALHNVEGALKAVGSSLRDVVRSRISIPRLEDVAPTLDYLGRRFEGVDPVVTVTCTPLAGADYLFEIEVTAYRGAGGLPEERIAVVL